jgi:hypothetical protein
MTVCILLVDYCRAPNKRLSCSSQPLCTQPAVRKPNISQSLHWRLHFRRSTKIKKYFILTPYPEHLLMCSGPNAHWTEAAPGLHGPSHIPFYRNGKQKSVNTVDSVEHLCFSQYKFLNTLLNIFNRRRVSKWGVHHYKESQAMLLKTCRNTISSPCLSCQHHNM